MPVLRELAGRLGQRAITVDESPWAELIEGNATSSGVAVTPEKSLQVSAVYACVRLLAESIAMQPVHLVRQRGRSRERLDPAESRLAWLMAVEPNSEMDAGELWRAVMVWMLLWGDAYAYVERNRGGAPVALWPLPTTAVNVGRTPSSRRLTYQVVTPQEMQGPGVPAAAALGPESILHFRAFGFGLTGLSPIGQIRESVGTSIAAQQYAARFYQADAAPGSYITTEGNLDDKQYDRMKAQWREAHEGLTRAHKLAVLEGGAEWKSVSLSPKDAEFIATRKFEKVEIASIYGVPPHMIADVERSTSWGSGIEQQNIAFAQYSLAPWVDRLERVCRRQLVAPTLGPRVRARWSMDGLLRGDTQARHNAYATGRQWGWYSTNDVRALEDMDPVAGGDVYLQPMNMVPAGTVTEPPRADDGGGAARGARQPAQEIVELRSRHVGELLTELRDRMADEQQAVLDAIGPTRPATADEIYDQEAHQQAITDLLLDTNRRIDGDVGAVVEGQLGRTRAARYEPDDEWLRTNAEMTARAIAATTRAQIDQDLDGKPDQPADEIVDTVYQTHVAARLPSIALTQATSVGQHAGHQAAEGAGAGTKTWMTTSGNPRASHAAQNGETVPIDARFANNASFPGDPVLPTDERAHCECVLTYS